MDPDLKLVDDQDKESSKHQLDISAGFWKKVLVALLISIGVLIGVLYGAQKRPSSVVVMPSPQISKAAEASPAPTVTPVKSITEVPGQFVKLQFDKTSSFFSDVTYPNELVNIPDVELVGLRCSKNYTTDYNGHFYNHGMNNADPIYELDDQFLLGLTKKFTNISDLSKCETEAGAVIVHYGIAQGGGGGGNTSSFGILNAEGQIPNVITIENDGVAYFGCRQPLAFTKNNIFYYKCGGGDGGFGQSSIYAIDLNNNTHKRVIRCKSVLEGFDDSPPKITCD